MKLRCLAALLISVPAFAQSGLTGNWSGTYSYSVLVGSCQNKVFTSTGNVTTTFLQIGPSLSGRMDFTDVLVFNGNCNPTKSEVTNVFVGSAGDSGITLKFPNDSSGTQLSGTVGGDTITLQISDVGGGSGPVTLTRTAADTPAADITGMWSGTYSFTDRCSNGGTQNYTGPFTLALTQNGARAAGVVTMQNVPLYNSSCQKLASLNVVMAAAGVVSGSTFTASVYDPAGSFDFQINTTISNGAMSGKVAGANQTSTTGTFTVNQSNSQPPASDLAGQYDGNYDEVDNETLFCFNIGSLAFSGASSVSIIQAGSAAVGWITLEDTQDIASNGAGGCVAVDTGEEVLPLYGTISGTTLTLNLPIGNGQSELFTINFGGSGMLTGTITDSFGDLLTLDGTRAGASAPPPPGPRRRAVHP